MTGTFSRIVVVLTVLACPLGASAMQPCPKRPKKAAVAKRVAAKWWSLAVQLFDVGSYSDAIKAWQCANRISPHPLALYNIARAAEAQGRLRYALTQYRRYLRLRPKASNREKVLTAMARLLKLLRPRPRPKEPVVKTPAKPPRVKPIGVRPVKPPGPAAPFPAVPSVRKKSARKPSAMVILGWTSIGLAAAMSGAAAAFGTLALNAKKKVESADVGTSWKSELRKAYKNYNTYKAIAWASVGVAGAAAVAGTLLLVFDKMGRSKEKVAVVPAILRSGGGLSVAGRF
jgi:tetratricopeptide (TPR) repeat protein